MTEVTVINVTENPRKAKSPVKARGTPQEPLRPKNWVGRVNTPQKDLPFAILAVLEEVKEPLSALELFEGYLEENGRKYNSVRRYVTHMVNNGVLKRVPVWSNMRAHKYRPTINTGLIQRYCNDMLEGRISVMDDVVYSSDM